MESDDEQIKQRIKDDFEEANKALPKKLRKPFEWTEKRQAQFKLVQENRNKNIELRKLAKQADLVPQKESPPVVAEDKKVETTPAPTPVKDEPPAIEVKKRRVLEQSDSDDSDLETFLEYKRKKHAITRYKETRTPRQNKKVTRFEDSEDDESDDDSQHYPTERQRKPAQASQFPRIFFA